MRKVKIKDNGGRNGQPSKSNIYLGERFRFREDTKHIGKWLLQKSLTFHSMVNLSTSGPQSYSCDRLWTGSMGACKSDKVILGGMGHWVPVRVTVIVWGLGHSVIVRVIEWLFGGQVIESWLKPSCLSIIILIIWGRAIPFTSLLTPW